MGRAPSSNGWQRWRRPHGRVPPCRLSSVRREGKIQTASVSVLSRSLGPHGVPPELAGISTVTHFAVKVSHAETQTTFRRGLSRQPTQGGAATNIRVTAHDVRVAGLPGPNHGHCSSTGHKHRTPPPRDPQGAVLKLRRSHPYSRLHLLVRDMPHLAWLPRRSLATVLLRLLLTGQ